MQASFSANKLSGWFISNMSAMQRLKATSEKRCYLATFVYFILHRQKKMEKFLTGPLRVFQYPINTPAALLNVAQTAKALEALFHRAFLASKRHKSY